MRFVMAATLRKNGFKVVEARDGLEAERAWESQGSNVDLVISDLLLPGKSGQELAMDFRKSRPDLKIIFASGNPKLVVMETSHLVKGSMFLLKPFTVGALIAAVEKAFKT